jgi:hypothetical protein
MNTPSFPSPNETSPCPLSDLQGRNCTGKTSRPLPAELVDLRMEATDDDSNLIALGKQFDEAVTRLRRLYDPASPNGHLELIESMLVGLEPIEKAIMAIPARTIAGLGVKARHAAYVISEHWDAPIDKIDWDARAVRSLVEAVCDVACVSLSSDSDSQTNSRVER